MAGWSFTEVEKAALRAPGEQRRHSMRKIASLGVGGCSGRRSRWYEMDGRSRSFNSAPSSKPTPVFGVASRARFRARRHAEMQQVDVDVLSRGPRRVLERQKERGGFKSSRAPWSEREARRDVEEPF